MTRKPAPIACHNSTVSGSRWKPEHWAWLHFERAWTDPGLGAGPYLKVPYEPPGYEREGMVHRVRPLRTGYEPVLVGGVWCWQKVKA